MQSHATRTAADYLPGRLSLIALRRASIDCRGCPLYRNETQTVFDSGSARAAPLFIGETPGDQEDLEGVPFVGPATKLLNEAFAAAGLDRRKAYLTNTVKHFKWEPQGKRRLHKKPNAAEERACQPGSTRKFKLSVRR